MRHDTLQAATTDTWQQARRAWRHIRDWPGNASNPYSPAFSIGLLLVIVLIINVNR